MISKNRRISLLLAVGFVLLLLFPNRSEALPQFSRRYNVKCSACHTIVPVLNEQGLLFQRLGYHLPPALSKGEVSPRLSEILDRSKWDITNNASFAVTDFSFSAERTTQEGQTPASTSAFQVANWNAYFAGWIPDTAFFYHAEFDIVSGGATNPNLSNACIGYGGGTVREPLHKSAARVILE